jgi:hypothetical protein
MRESARRAFVLLLGVAVALVCAAPSAARDPVDLHGSALGPHTGLRLLVEDTVPFVLDVDRGTIARVDGLPRSDGVGYTVLPLSRDAAVATSWHLSRPDTSKAQFLVRASGATPLGPARDVVPFADGLGVWATRFVRPRACRLQSIALDGRRGTGLAVPCSWVTAPAGSLGLVVGRTRVIDPRTGRTVLRERNGIVAVAGDHLLVAGGPRHAPGYRFTLVDAATGARRTFAWPSTVGGSDAPAVDPRGRYIAIGFADPSWELSGWQVMDVWILDTTTGKLTQLPGMPAYVSLKGTCMQWTHDGRLVILASNDGHAYVAAWRPGMRTLPMKRVPLPARRGGSDCFAPLA